MSCQLDSQLSGAAVGALRVTFKGGCPNAVSCTLWSKQINCALGAQVYLVILYLMVEGQQ